MDQIKVQIVGLEIFQGFLKGIHGLIVARILNPDFGGQEDLRSGDAAVLDRFPHGPLIAITGGGVDETVASF